MLKPPPYVSLMACSAKILLDPAECLSLGYKSDLKMFNLPKFDQHWNLIDNHIILQNGCVMYNNLANLGKIYSKHSLEMGKQQNNTKSACKIDKLTCSSFECYENSVVV